MKPNFYYPVKKWVINQAWGTYHPEIYSQFGFTNHNGIDVAPGEGKEVRAEIPCVYWKTLNQPNGGGITLGVLSTDEYTFPDGITAKVLIDYLHLERIVMQPGQTAKVGDLLCIADNTGFSSGTHTHIQYRRVSQTVSGLTILDTNNANNSFDPEPYRNRQYAVDYGVSVIQVQIDRIRQKLVELLTYFKK